MGITLFLASPGPQQWHPNAAPASGTGKPEPRKAGARDYKPEGNYDPNGKGGDSCREAGEFLPLFLLGWATKKVATGLIRRHPVATAITLMAPVDRALAEMKMLKPADADSATKIPAPGSPTGSIFGIW
jgi:hypothetical protein